MAYYLYRISVVPREQTFLFGPDGGPPDERLLSELKEEYLARVFAEDLSFVSRGRSLHFVSRYRTAEFIGGYIAKQGTIARRGTPKSRLEREDNFPTSNVYLSLRHDRSSQLIAIQWNAKVGRTDPLIRAIVQEINQRNSWSHYELLYAPVLERGTYRTIAEREKGRITEARFFFFVPNPWFLDDDKELDAALASYRNNEGAQVVEHAIKNDKGEVVADTPRLLRFAKRVEDGLGKAELRTGNFVAFRSDRKSKPVDISDKSSIADMDESQFEANADEMSKKWEK